MTVRRAKNEEAKAGHLDAAIPLDKVAEIAFFQEQLADTALLCLLGELGLRQQEAHPLSWDQLLWPGDDGQPPNPRATIEIETAVSGTYRTRTIGGPKSRASRRRVPFYAPSAAVLLALWHEQGCPPLAPHSLVFPVERPDRTDGQANDRLIERNNWVKRRFVPALDALYGQPLKLVKARTNEPSPGKVPLEIVAQYSGQAALARYGVVTPHRLRSAAASAAGSAGLSIPQAMQAFGWSQTDTMFRYYMRATEDSDPARAWHASCRADHARPPPGPCPRSRAAETLRGRTCRAASLARPRGRSDCPGRAAQATSCPTRRS